MIFLILGFLTIYVLFLAVGLFFLWKATKGIRSIALRSLIRSIGLAVTFAPTIVSGGLHIALPMPAFWVLICGIFGWGSGNMMQDIKQGAVAIIFTTFFIYPVMVIVALFMRFRSARS